jgi:hypothetical protein
MMNVFVEVVAIESKSELRLDRSSLQQNLTSNWRFVRVVESPRKAALANRLKAICLRLRLWMPACIDRRAIKRGRLGHDELLGV